MRSHGSAESSALSPTSSMSMGEGSEHIRLDAAMLRALARDAIELADGDGELTVHGPLRPAIERHEVLHGALAERALAEHDAAVIVLDRAGEDLRGGGAEAVHEHGERAVVGDAGLRVIEHFEAAGGVLELHDRAAIDEQAGEGGRFGQIAAAVVTQVEHERRRCFPSSAPRAGGARRAWCCGSSRRRRSARRCPGRSRAR